LGRTVFGDEHTLPADRTGAEPKLPAIFLNKVKASLYKVVAFVYKVTASLYTVAAFVNKVTASLYTVVAFVYKVAASLYTVAAFVHKVAASLYKVMAFMYTIAAILYKATACMYTIAAILHKDTTFIYTMTANGYKAAAFPFKKTAGRSTKGAIVPHHGHPLFNRGRFTSGPAPTLQPPGFVRISSCRRTSATPVPNADPGHRTGGPEQPMRGVVGC